MTTAVAIKEPQLTPVQLFVGSILSGEKRNEIATALPAHVSFDRFERNLSNAVMREPKLLKVDPRVVFREVCKIAALGLVLDPQLGEAYLIVDRNNDVQARVGYRGLMKLAHQSGKVSTIYAHDICENDRCDISLGTEKRITHHPDFTKPRGPAVAYYAVVQFKDGVADFEPMSIAEINAIRDRSDAYRAFKRGLIKATPWDSDHGEMAKKTALRRLLKRVPMSPDLERALAMEDDADERDRFVVDNATGEIRPAPRSLSERMDMLAAGPAEDAVTTDHSEQPETESEVVQHTIDEPLSVDDKTPPRSPESPDAAGGVDDPACAADHATPGQSADDNPAVQGEPAAKTLADYDTELLEAAKRGTAALQEAWAAVPAGMKPSLKAALDRRHKPAAAAADADLAGSEASQAAPTTDTEPTTEAEYVLHATAWIKAATSRDAALAQWTREKKLRNACNVSPEVRDQIRERLDVIGA